MATLHSNGTHSHLVQYWYSWILHFTAGFAVLSGSITFTKNLEMAKTHQTPCPSEKGNSGHTSLATIASHWSEGVPPCLGVTGLDWRHHALPPTDQPEAPAFSWLMRWKLYLNCHPPSTWQTWVFLVSQAYWHTKQDLVGSNHLLEMATLCLMKGYITLQVGCYLKLGRFPLLLLG